MASLKNIPDLLTEAATNVPDNTTQQCSPQDLRELSENIAFSSFNKITDDSIVGLKEYDAGISYPNDQWVSYLGDLYQANKVTTPGAFNVADWDILVTGAVDTNFTTGNLTMTANRDHNLAGFLLEFSGGEMRFQGSDDLEATTNFSLQNNSGNTLAAFRNNGTFIQSLFTSATADGNLHNNSVNLYTDGTSLKARYKDNGGTASDLTIGGVSTDVCAIYDSAGTPTYYATISSAISAASAGETVQILADITEATATEIILKDGVNINGNGHTYTNSNAGANDAVTDNNVAVTCKILNWTVVRTTGTGYCFHIDNVSTEIDATGSLFKMSGASHTILCQGKLSNCEAENTGGTSFGAFLGNPTGYFHNCRTTNSAIGFHTFANCVNCYAETTNESFYFTSNPAGDIHMVGCYGYSSGDYAGYFNAVDDLHVTGCNFDSDGNVGVYLTGSNPSEFVGCNIKSTSSNGVNVLSSSEVKFVGCHIESTALYGISGSTSSIIKVIDCSVKASAASTIRQGSSCTFLITGGVLECAWNNASGHVIDITVSSNTTRVNNAELIVANTSASCIYAAIAETVVYTHNQYGGNPTTAVHANVTQGSANTEDTYGNIKI